MHGNIDPHGVTQTLLLTLGRLPKGLDIARAFAAAGWRVIVAEPFRYHLAGASRAVSKSLQVSAPAQHHAAYLAEITDIIAREHVDLVIPVSEETMHVAHLRGRIPDNVTLFTMPPALVLDLHDKFRFIQIAQGFGLDVPDTVSLGDPAGAAMAEAGFVVVKPILSCSGRGVRILPRGTALPAPDPAEPAIVQRFVPGDVYSTCTIAHQGRAVVTVIYRGGTMSGTVAVSFEHVPRLDAITSWVDAFVEKTSYTGFISFDFVVDAEGRAFAIECNPRATSGLHFIEPHDLVTAILAPDTVGTARMRPTMHMQQFYSALTETQRSFGDWPRFRANLHRLRTARDVTWSARDPMPFVTMPFTSWQIIAMSIRHRVTFGEVATLDVGWYGKEERPGARPLDQAGA
jgi:predicted ATP-grasp superfamily ATP-dependent carboligase